MSCMHMDWHFSLHNLEDLDLKWITTAVGLDCVLFTNTTSAQFN